MNYLRFSLVSLVFLIGIRAVVVYLGLDGGRGYSDNLAIFVPTACAAALEGQLFVRRNSQWPRMSNYLQLSWVGALIFLMLCVAVSLCAAVFLPEYRLSIMEPLGLGSLAVDLLATAAICFPMIGLWAVWGAWSEVRRLRKKGKLP